MERELCRMLLIFIVCMCLATGCNKVDYRSPIRFTKCEERIQDDYKRREDITVEDVKLKFMWWGNESRHKATVQALELFQDRNPNIKVEGEYGGWASYFDRLAIQLAGDMGPDIAQMSITNVIEYVHRNQLAPINDLFDEGYIDISFMPEDLLNMFKIEGKYYALPSGIGCRAIFYNKNIFDRYEIEYPNENWTWVDYLTTAEEITRYANSDGKIDIRGTADISYMDHIFPKLLYEQGGRMWSEDLSEAVFDSPQGLEAMKLFKKTLDDGLVSPPSITASHAPDVDMFMLGNLAMMLGLTPDAQKYQTNTQFEIGMTKLPNGEDKNAVYTWPSMVYVITKDCKHQEEAAQLLDFILNDEEAGKILSVERGVPVNTNIRDMLELDLDEVGQQVLKAINETIEASGDIEVEGYPLGYIDILEMMEKEKTAMFFGKKTPEQALKDMEDNANRIISRYR